jgi:hypothetical protein
MTPNTEAAPIPASPQSNPSVETAEIALGTVGRVWSAVEGAETVPLSGDPERAETDLAALGRRLVRQRWRGLQWPSPSLRVGELGAEGLPASRGS